MTPVRVLLVVGILVGGSLTGCASDTQQYCGTLRQDRPTLNRLASTAKPGSHVVPRTLAVFQNLRDQAPDDIRDEWDTMVFAWQTLAAAFRKAGVNPAAYRPGKTPGVSAQQDKAIRDAAAQLSSPRVLDASQGIEQQAHDICKVDLGL
jgi:hypothetical protein